MIQTEIVSAKYSMSDKIVRIQLPPVGMSGELQGYTERPERIDVGRSMVQHDGGFYWIVPYFIENFPDMLRFSLFRKTACRVSNTDKLESVEVCKCIIDGTYIRLLYDIEGLPSP